VEIATGLFAPFVEDRGPALDLLELTRATAVMSGLCGSVPKRLDLAQLAHGSRDRLPVCQRWTDKVKIHTGWPRFLQRKSVTAAIYNGDGPSARKAAPLPSAIVAASGYNAKKRQVRKVASATASAGFHIAEFSSHVGVFFGTNAKGARHMVEITPTDCGQRLGCALPHSRISD
jgi:hypothetical protein